MGFGFRFGLRPWRRLGLGRGFRLGYRRHRSRFLRNGCSAIFAESGTLRDGGTALFAKHIGLF